MNNTYLKYFPINKVEPFYSEYISFILNKEKEQDRKFEISVIHHIVPKSFLPKEWRKEKEADINNTLEITPYEHLQAHELLYRAFPHTSMANALYLMINDKDRYDLDISHITEEEYNQIYKDYKESQSRILKEFYANNEEIHKRLSAQRKGKVFINNGQIEKLVDPKVAEDYIATEEWWYGMIKGRKKSEETRARMRLASKLKFKNYKYIYNVKDPNISKRVLPEEAEKFVKTGEWEYGRGNIKTYKDTSHLHTPEVIEKQKQVKKTLIAINNGQKMKRVRPEKLQEWLNKGWVEGVYVSQETKDKIKNNQPEEHYWSEESRNIIRESNSRRKGFKVMNKEGKNKQVKLEEIENYLNEGWELGFAKV